MAIKPSFRTGGSALRSTRQRLEEQRRPSSTPSPDTIRRQTPSVAGPLAQPRIPAAQPQRQQPAPTIAPSTPVLPSSPQRPIPTSPPVRTDRPATAPLGPLGPLAPAPAGPRGLPGQGPGAAEILPKPAPRAPWLGPAPTGEPKALPPTGNPDLPPVRPAAPLAPAPTGAPRGLPPHSDPRIPEAKPRYAPEALPGPRNQPPVIPLSEPPTRPQTGGTDQGAGVRRLGVARTAAQAGSPWDYVGPMGTVRGLHEYSAPDKPFGATDAKAPEIERDPWVGYKPPLMPEVIPPEIERDPWVGYKPPQMPVMDPLDKSFGGFGDKFGDSSQGSIGSSRQALTAPSTESAETTSQAYASTDASADAPAASQAQAEGSSGAGWDSLTDQQKQALVGIYGSEEEARAAHANQMASSGHFDENTRGPNGVNESIWNDVSAWAKEEYGEDVSVSIDWSTGRVTISHPSSGSLGVEDQIFSLSDGETFGGISNRWRGKAEGDRYRGMSDEEKTDLAARVGLSREGLDAAYAEGYFVNENGQVVMAGSDGNWVEADPTMLDRMNDRAQEKAGTAEPSKIDEWIERILGSEAPTMDDAAMEEKIQAMKAEQAMSSARAMRAAMERAARGGMSADATTAMQAELQHQGEVAHVDRAADARLQHEAQNFSAQMQHYQNMHNTMMTAAQFAQTEEEREQMMMAAKSAQMHAQRYQKELMELQWEMQNRVTGKDVLGGLLGGVTSLGGMALGGWLGK